MLARTSTRRLPFQRSKPGRRLALCGLALWLPCAWALEPVASPGNAQAQASPDHAAAEPVILAIQLNGSLVSSGAQLRRSNSGVPLLPATELQSWHLRVPPAAPERIDGVDYYPLTLFHVASYRIDSATQTLFIEAAPDAFESTRIDASALQLQSPTPASPGMFFNYDLYAQRNFGVDQEGGLFEIGGFNRYGVGTADWISQRGGTNAGTVRLDTTWRSDFPERMASLSVGDLISRSGAWGSSARMGGIQFGTNFATQPRFVTTPLYAMPGQAALPSV